MSKSSLALRHICCLTVIGWLSCIATVCQAQPTPQPDHGDLLAFFKAWRKFEQPPLLDGAPDYTAETFATRYKEYLGLRAKLDAMDISDWLVPHQVDWHLMRGNEWIRLQSSNPPTVGPRSRVLPVHLDDPERRPRPRRTNAPRSDRVLDVPIPA